jgi:hypothetical protein
MKFKIPLIILTLSVFFLACPAKAVFISNTYKQGIYTIDAVKEYNATAKLMSSNTMYLSIFDSNGNERVQKKFDNKDEVINLGIIHVGDTIVIVGTGEVAISI